MEETGIGLVHRRDERIHWPDIQGDKHGTTVEISMEDSSHIILTSELVWDQMGLGTPTRADRDIGEIPPAHLARLLKVLGRAQACPQKTQHGPALWPAWPGTWYRDFLRPQEGTGMSPTTPNYQEAWPLLEVTCWKSSTRTQDRVVSESTGLPWVEGLPGLFLQS